MDCRGNMFGHTHAAHDTFRTEHTIFVNAALVGGVPRIGLTDEEGFFGRRFDTVIGANEANRTHHQSG